MLNLPSVRGPCAVRVRTFLSDSLCVLQPHAFIEKLSEHNRSLEEAELKEKQLAALRVDVCSTEALKRLKG